MYGIGSDGKGREFAQNCLLARRLVERGVRVVQVYYGHFQPWDSHSDNSQIQGRLCREVDPPLAALLTDLKQRGLLDETLVLWGGEFGRTPVLATMLHLMGLDHERLTYRYSGRDFRLTDVHGRVLHDIIS